MKSVRGVAICQPFSLRLRQMNYLLQAKDTWRSPRDVADLLAV